MNNQINSIAELEHLRISILKQKILCILIGIGAFIPIVLVSKIYILLFFGGMSGFFISSFIIKNKKQIFNIEYKRLIIFEVIKKHFTNITFMPDNGFNEEYINSFQVLNKPDRFSSNDYITAKYKNINFEACDICLEKKFETDDTTKYIPYFKGQWYIFSFHKPFKTNIKIYSKRFNYSQISRQYNYHKIELEDIRYNKKFNTYTEKELDAFRVLTPQIIERINKISDSASGKVLLCFENNKLHIAVDNDTDSFEPNLIKKINVQKVEEKTLSEIKDIIQFITDLDLDKTIFRKEV